MAELPPVRRQIVVPVAPEVAFAAFTADIGAWWPLASHSVHGAKSSVAFIDGDLVEESPDGREVWGSVLEWTPPQRLRMTWHAGSTVDRATEVSVRFDEAGTGTLVTLEHSGWERLADPTGSRSSYATGWIAVLHGFESYGGAPEAPVGDEAIWLALSHTPGVDAPADGDVLADPRIRQHFGFVSELQREGVLVGAGPIEGRTGHGMTVIRTTPDRVADDVRRAQDDDPSVAGGLLQV
ncbi:MAG TPA: SRPBCC domain-containing protein, partial [Micromonosporaceae bacterium]